DLDREPLRLQRLEVELAEHELLGEVLIADRHRRTAGTRQRAGRRAGGTGGVGHAGGGAAARERHQDGRDGDAAERLAAAGHAASPAARRASACAARSSSSASGASGACSPSAVSISQSANQAFLGSSGPCRYVPSTLRTRPPSCPSLPLFPWPLMTLPSGS